MRTCFTEEPTAYVKNTTCTIFVVWIGCNCAGLTRFFLEDGVHNGVNLTRREIDGIILGWKQVCLRPGPTRLKAARVVLVFQRMPYTVEFFRTVVIQQYSDTNIDVGYILNDDFPGPATNCDKPVVR